MSPIYDCRDEAQLLTGMRQARQAIGRGELVVIPTDTVYGVAADAFDHAAVARLLAAKGRGRQSPPPVLVAGLTTLRALVAEVPEPVERLVEAYWPGGLTIVLPSQPSLSWDLGETRGTVAVRMPAHRIALELLEETGPLAVSSANLTGMAAGITAEDAEGMLKDSVAVYLGDERAQRRESCDEHGRRGLASAALGSEQARDGGVVEGVGGDAVHGVGGDDDELAAADGLARLAHAGEQLRLVTAVVDGGHVRGSLVARPRTNAPRPGRAIRDAGRWSRGRAS